MGVSDRDDCMLISDVCQERGVRRCEMEITVRQSQGEKRGEGKEV